MCVVSVEVGGASGRRFAVRMGLFMWGGCERREGREEKGWAADRACWEMGRTFQLRGQKPTVYCLLTQERIIRELFEDDRRRYLRNNAKVFFIEYSLL